MLSRIRGLPARAWWGLAAAHAAAIALLSLLPLPAGDTGLPFADKLVHFALYAGLFFLIWRAVCARRVSPATDRFSVFLFCTAYGASIEMLQAHLVPQHRAFSVADILANAAGSAAAALLVGTIARRRLNTADNQE